MKLHVEYIPVDSLKPYSGNAKIHTAEQIEQIKDSIKEFGMNDPIGIWGPDNIIVEGHGRLMALKELGYTEAPVIRLDDLTDEQRRAYTLIHNQTTMNTGFDLDILEAELSKIDMDMTGYGFDLGDMDLDELDNTLTDEKYTTKVDIPQYQITGEEPAISELTNNDKLSELLVNIEKSNVTEEQKEFLRCAAYRHLVFNYAKIAEYYAHQDKEMQELMENSALVIIDFDDAVRNGYVELKEAIDLMCEDDNDDE